MSDLYTRINELSARVEPKMIAWRRDIHEHPELGNQEIRTAGLVAEHLRQIGVDEVYEQIAGSTGVIGIIHGSHPGPVVGLRADMDALPIYETADVPFASRATQVWGDQGTVPVMHACGHDIHTATLMAAAEVIVAMRDSLNGKVLLCFQPAEEHHASDWVGKSGAAAMVEDPIFLANKPEAFFALHIETDAPRGSAGDLVLVPGLAGGFCMWIFKLAIHGKGGHGASPWVGTDALVNGAQVLLGIQTIISRNIDVYHNDATISIGTFHSGKKFNVVSDLTTMEGAIRFSDVTQKDYLKARLEEVVHGIARSGRCEAELSFDWFPPLINDAGLVEVMKGHLMKTIGPDKIIQDRERVCKFLDDYAYFIQDTPGIYATLSVVSDPEDHYETHQVHDADFRANERAFLNGIKTMATFALAYGHDKS